MLIQFCDTRTPLPKKIECFFRQRTYLHRGSSSFPTGSVFWRICILISFSMENIVMCYLFCEPINTLNSFPVASQMLLNNFSHVTCLALVSDSHANNIQKGSPTRFTVYNYSQPFSFDCHISFQSQSLI